MNNRFKLALTLLTTRHNKKGFALVITFAVGAIMVLTAAVIMTRSTQDKTKVLAQKKTANVVAITEAGLTQYSNFLDQNRALLQYPSCEGTPNASTGVCPDTGTAASWANITNNDIITPPTPTPAAIACPNDKDNPTDAEKTEISVTWANKNGDTWIASNGGEFRLIGYQYYPNGNTDGTIGTGRMIVEGRTTGGGTEGQARVAIDFPISINGVLPIPNNAPGLWARSFDTAADVYANVLDSSGCNDSGNTAFTKSLAKELPNIPLSPLPNGNLNATKIAALSSGTTATVTEQVRDFPPLPAYPTASEFAILEAGSGDYMVNRLDSCDSKTAYPATGDYDSTGTAFDSALPPSEEKTYIYHVVNNCTLPSDTVFGATGKDNIIMYIDSNLDIGNNAEIANDGSSRSTKVLWLLKTANLDLGGNSQVGSAAPDGSTASNWAFFLYDGTSFSMRGTADYYAFVYAPNANADLRGNPKIGGALWVKSFETNGAPQKVFQAINQDQFEDIFETLYTNLDPSLMNSPEPSLASANSWERLEIPDQAFADFPTP